MNHPIPNYSAASIIKHGAAMFFRYSAPVETCKRWSRYVEMLDAGCPEHAFYYIHSSERRLPDSETFVGADKHGAAGGSVIPAASSLPHPELIPTPIGEERE